MMANIQILTAKPHPSGSAEIETVRAAIVAVCAMLEAMRAHAQNDALKNDIYFLLTNGEELGLLGAQAFVGAHPELRDKIDAIWFVVGSYLLYISLVCMTVAVLFKKWAVAHLAARALCGVIRIRDWRAACAKNLLALRWHM